jgi:hypothetical protein
LQSNSFKQEELKIQLQLQEQEEEEEVTFVTDTIGDESLRPLEQDYIPFPSLESDDTDDSYVPRACGKQAPHVYRSRHYEL